jgi:hypothetical protein
MENRIQIDGIWYVRENEVKPAELKPEDVVHTMSCVWESGEWIFDAEVCLRNDDPKDYYPSPTIDITGKRGDRDGWVRENIDNPYWMLGFLENDSESMNEAHKILDAEGLSLFKGFLNYLIEKGWLVKD